MVRRLLIESNAKIYTLDKCGYASDLTSIKALAAAKERHLLLPADLANAKNGSGSPAGRPRPGTAPGCREPWDRSISGPVSFISSNVNGTFNLLQAVRSHWEALPKERRATFRFHHISTDEVFGSLGPEGRFSETTPYDPRSPYSASKAASDHLVRAWHHTYGLPAVITNCSNNFGPWQYPEKLIPVVILKAAAGEAIPLYGDGLNVRDWLYVDDHVEALLLAATRGRLGASYCVGGCGERNNREVVEAICTMMDQLRPQSAPHAHLITLVSDRPGHDRRYAIDPTLINSELGWQPRHSFESGTETTVRWYLNNLEWCKAIQK